MSLEANNVFFDFQQNLFIKNLAGLEVHVYVYVMIERAFFGEGKGRRK